MSGDNKVIYLAYSNPKLDERDVEMLSCKACQNKTFFLSYRNAYPFPMLRCAACHWHIGEIGWATP